MREAKAGRANVEKEWISTSRAVGRNDAGGPSGDAPRGVNRRMSGIVKSPRESSGLCMGEDATHWRGCSAARRTDRHNLPERSRGRRAEAGSRIKRHSASSRQ